ncbi:MBG domain-containing protein [Parapedobacter composti]|nr:MBG domain-containing protein [Parapedobacter composti]
MHTSLLAHSPAVKSGDPYHGTGYTYLGDAADVGNFRYSATDATGSEGAPVIQPDDNNILYVDIGKKGVEGHTATGSSWANAVPELRDALEFAQSWNAEADGQLKIWVAGGKYNPASDETDREASFRLVNGVELYGGFAGDEPADYDLSLRDFETNRTILSGDIDNNDAQEIITDPATQIQGNNSYHVVYADGVDSTALLDGFTITGGQANGGGYYSYGGGMYNNNGSSPELRNVFISGNTASWDGGGMFNYNNSSPVLTNATISGNTASSGGGMYNANSSSPVLTNVTISGNTASWGGGGGMFNYNNSSPVLTNATISGNTASQDGGGMYNLSSSPVLTNVTITGNKTSGIVAGIFVNGSSTLHLNNSIVFDNTKSDGSVDNLYAPEGNEMYIQRSLLQGNPTDWTWDTDWTGTDGGENVVTAENPFSDPANGDYRLKAGSPAINAGSNQLYSDAGGDLANDTDLAGNPRVYNFAGGGIIDLGAYEYQDEPPIAIQPDANNILYVDIGKKDVAGHTATGSSWDNAIPELADALQWAGENGERFTAENPLQIWVAKGVYQPEPGRAFSMVQNVQIYGGFSGTEDSGFERSQRDFQTNETILEGNGNRVITNENNGLTAASVLDGFTIRGGRSTGNGGGIYNKDVSPLYTNLVIRNNNADIHGGGLYIDGGHPVLTRSVIENNNAGFLGGGAYISTHDLTLINVEIRRNTAGTFGGGLHNFGKRLKLVNVSITENSSGNTGRPNGGGGIYNGGDQFLGVNLTLAGNTNEGNPSGIHLEAFDDMTFSVWNSIVADPATQATNGTQVSGDVQHSIWQGNYYGEEGAATVPVEMDRLFRNSEQHDYQLQPNSPAINAGSNQLYSDAGGDLENDTDVAGNPRIVGGTVDLGAYESAFEDIVSLAGLQPIAVSHGTAWGDIEGLPASVTATLSDGTEAAVALADTAQWTLVSAPTAAGDGYNGTVAGDYVFSAPLALPDPNGGNWFSNSKGLAAAVTVTVGKGTPVWSVTLGDEPMAEGDTLLRTYGDVQLLEVDIQLWDGDSSQDISFTVNNGEGLLDMTQFPQVSATGVGEVQVEVTFGGTDNFVAATATYALRIQPRAITVEAEPAEKVYGDDDPALNVRLSEGSNPLAFQDAIGDVVGTVSRTAGEDAGSYAIHIGRDGSKSGLYDISFDEGNEAFTIRKATAVLSLGGLQHVYDGSAKPATVATVPEGLGGSVRVTYNGSPEPPVHAGEYEVEAVLEHANYAADAVTGTLVIEEADLTGITFADGRFTYDGTAHSIYVSGAPEGASVSYEGNGRTDAGTYTVTARVSLANHKDLVLTAELVIDKATAVLSLGGLQHVYDGSAKPATVATVPEGLGGSVRVTYNGSPEPPIHAGEYEVVAALEHANYVADAETGTLVISRARRSIIFPALPEKTYGDTDFAPGATASTGEAVIYRSSDPSVAEITPGGLIRIVGAGTAEITATVAEHPDYMNRPEIRRTLTVHKAAQRITLSAPSEVGRDAGSVPVTATSTSGLSVSLSVDDPEVATLEGNTLRIHRLGTVRITGTQPGDGNHAPAEPVTVTVRVVDPASDFPVRVSKAVSPNGDGINEYLIIEAVKDHPENKVTIFNRNGTVVYEARGYNNGTVAFRGIGTGRNHVPAGTYFYVAEVKVNGKWVYDKGWFVLRY